MDFDEQNLRRAVFFNNTNNLNLSPNSLPRPRPQFITDSVTFSTKKEKSTPKLIDPPRPPIKSCPPVSRLRPSRRPENEGPRVVSFVNRNLNNSIMTMNDNSSPMNSEDSVKLDQSEETNNKTKLYFEQFFLIEGYLGCGSFGMVYKVKSKVDGKYYAVKKSKEKFKGSSDRKRKLEEVAKHEGLPDHPNFVRFYRAWEEKQKLYMQIELCQMSLSTYATKHHDIPEDTIWQFLIDILQAVKHLHDRDLIHMDIKPDNIFISCDGICKLGDFGLVVDLKKDDLREVQEGDPKYLAPEVLKGSHNITTAVDIFSLGMSILELATDLDLPRGGEAWHQLREGLIPSSITKSLSSELVQIIHQMIDGDNTRRVNANDLLDVVHVKRRLAEKRRAFSKNLFDRLRQSYSYILQFVAFLTSPIVMPFVSGWKVTKQLIWSSQKLEDKNSMMKSFENNDISNNQQDEDSNQNSKLRNNTTSTPKKNDSQLDLQVNLMNINDDEDEDSNGKMLRNLSNLIKHDQNDYKMWNISNNESLNSNSGIYNDESDSISLSDLESKSKLKSTTCKTTTNRKKMATKLEFSPTSISPSGSSSRKHLISTKILLDSSEKDPQISEYKELSSLNFTRQKLNFEDECDENNI